MMLTKNGFDSDPDHERLVCEIYFDGLFFALISQERAAGLYDLETPGPRRGGENGHTTSRPDRISRRPLQSLPATKIRGVAKGRVRRSLTGLYSPAFPRSGIRRGSPSHQKKASRPSGDNPPRGRKRSGKSGQIATPSPAMSICGFAPDTSAGYDLAAPV
jgi:hypothetical protein